MLKTPRFVKNIFSKGKTPLADHTKSKNTAPAKYYEQIESLTSKFPAVLPSERSQVEEKRKAAEITETP